jgi:hypothetical protein
MIAAWMQKAATPLIVLGLMVIAAMFLGWLALRTVDGMLDDVRLLTRAERDADWQAKIEKANAATNKQAAEQVSAALRIQAETSDKVTTAEKLLAELKVKNAQLPRRDDCGLSLERGQLLPD